jgi:hypothetical protein
VDGIQKQIKNVHTGHFAECNTRQRGSLPSVKTIALGKEPRPEHRYRFFAECNACDTRQRGTLCRVLLGRHSAKTPSPSPVAVTDTFLYRVLPGTRQRRLYRCIVCRAFFVECHTRQSLCRVFFRLCRVLRALGKALVSGSGALLHFVGLGTGKRPESKRDYIYMSPTSA